RNVHKQINCILRLARMNYSKLEEFTQDTKMKLQARARGGTKNISNSFTRTSCSERTP
ncbi:hypothetical protein M9458_045043, partial [Cirrhinus mrigala]